MDNSELLHLLNKSANLMGQAAQTFARMAELLETSNQPLPDPPKAPLVGDDEPSGIVAVNIDAAKMQHVYPGIVGGKFIRTSNCANGCGAWMGGSRSGGPPGIDPFGACPALRFEDHVHEVGSCICDRWPTDARLREFIAEHGGAVSVLDCMVSFGIEIHADAIAMLGEAIGRGAIESTTDETGAVWYQLATPGEPPASKVHPVESRELPTAPTPTVEFAEEPDNKTTVREWADDPPPSEVRASVHLTCIHDCVISTDHDGLCMDVHGKDFIGTDIAPTSEVRPVVSHEFGAEQCGPPAIESVPLPPSGVRKKNEFTAREWATGPHFLALMKQKEFAAWDVTEQNQRRDTFVAWVSSANPEKRMSRWGQQFKIFHGMKARP